MSKDPWEARAERHYEASGRHPIRYGLGLVAAVCAVILFGSVMANAFGIANIYWQATKAKITVAPRVTKQVYDTQNVIAKVAFFHERCTGVQEKVAIYKNNYARLLSAREAAHLTTDPLERQAAIQALPGAQQDVTAALNAAQSDVAAYNAAAANPNVAPFRTIFSQHGLPERIELPPGEAAASNYQLSCG